MYTTLAAGAKALLGDQRSAHAGANEAARAQYDNLDRHVLTSSGVARKAIRGAVVGSGGVNTPGVNTLVDKQNQ